MRCERPPEGWTCSRPPGHDGPCAADRAVLSVPEFPTWPDGTPLTAMRVSADPERFVYGDGDTLDWLRGRMERLDA